ncbi:MAG: phosphatase PAP2 family protein [Cyclobacteriaceae bacterium]|nr:phosphatase PAP2 family protein [Cyclobacteriaceae bacterium]
MLETIDQIDRNVFLYFNGKYSHFSDQLWLAITNSSTWIPLYLILILLILKKFGKESLWILGGLVLVILASDQFTSSFMKPFFERLRPCHDPALGQLVHIAKSCGGQYGFASSHAANTFGVAMFLWLAMKKYYHAMVLLFVWSSLVAFSRIMVGVHYPGDIIVGSLVGMGLGWIIFKITEAIHARTTGRILIKN